MSNISVIAEEFESNSEFSRQFNLDVITIKKKALGLSGSEEMSKEEIENARDRLINEINKIQRELKEERSSRTDLAKEDKLTRRFRNSLKRKGEEDFFVEDLGRLLSHLESGLGDLTEEDIKRLDELSTIAEKGSAELYNIIFEEL